MEGKRTAFLFLILLCTETWAAPQEASADLQQARADLQQARTDLQGPLDDPQLAREDPKEALADLQKELDDPQEAGEDPQEARADLQKELDDLQKEGEDLQEPMDDLKDEISEGDINGKNNVRGILRKRLDPSTIVAGAIGAGATLATLPGTLASLPYSVACAIQVENYSKWPMTDPHVFANSGYIKDPPVKIHPGERMIMSAHKAGGATGTWGTVSWKIGNFARAIVMWSAPYNHHYYNNRLAVGIIGPYDYSNPEKWAKTMYYGHGNFVTRDYYNSVRTIKYCKHTHPVCIKGSMGTNHKPSVEIVIYPKSYDDLAPKIKEYIQPQDYTYYVNH